MGREAVRIGEGWKQWHGRGIAAAPFLDAAITPPDPFHSDQSGFDTEHSPLLYVASAAPLLIWPKDFATDSAMYWRWLPRIPFLACGVFLGASLWYVARRLCGNTGGFIALILYCFSPSLIQASAVWHAEPELFADIEQVAAQVPFAQQWIGILVAVHAQHPPARHADGLH